MAVRQFSGYGTLGYKGGEENLTPTTIKSDYFEMLAQQAFTPACYSGTSTAYSGISLTQTGNVKERKSMFKQVTEYVDKHKDVIFTLTFVILIDHFLFKGALKNRIQSAIEGVIKKVEDRIGEK